MSPAIGRSLGTSISTGCASNAPNSELLIPSRASTRSILTSNGASTKISRTADGPAVSINAEKNCGCRALSIMRPIPGDQHQSSRNPVTNFLASLIIRLKPTACITDRVGSIPSERAILAMYAEVLAIGHPRILESSLARVVLPAPIGPANTSKCHRAESNSKGSTIPLPPGRGMTMVVHSARFIMLRSTTPAPTARRRLCTSDASD